MASIYTLKKSSDNSKKKGQYYYRFKIYFGKEHQPVAIYKSASDILFWNRADTPERELALTPVAVPTFVRGCFRTTGITLYL